MLILLKKYVSTKIVSKYYIFYINFYVMFVLLSNIFILCQININNIIWMDRLGHVKCIKFNTNFLQTVYNSIIVLL